MLLHEPELIVAVGIVEESQETERGFICGAGVRGKATLRVKEILQGKLEAETADFEWMFNDGERKGPSKGEEAIWFLRPSRKEGAFLVCGEWGSPIGRKEEILRMIQDVERMALPWLSLVRLGTGSDPRHARWEESLSINNRGIASFRSRKAVGQPQKLDPKERSRLHQWVASFQPCSISSDDLTLTFHGKGTMKLDEKTRKEVLEWSTSLLESARKWPTLNGGPPKE